MKNLILYFSITLVSFLSTAQKYHHYEMLNEYTNYILDRYNIDYTGPHGRYMVESGEVNQLDKVVQDSMIAAYYRFLKFNKNYFQTVPTTDSPVLSNCALYLENKDCDNFTKMICSDTRLIVGFYRKVVNDLENNIKTIEILEMNSASTTNIEIAIFIEDFNNFFTLLTPQDIPGIIECGQCPAD